MPQKLEFSFNPETKEVKQETKIKEDGKVVGRSFVDAVYDIKNAVYKASTKVFNECDEEVNKYREGQGSYSVDTETRRKIVRGVVHPQVEQLFDGARNSICYEWRDCAISEILFRLSNQLTNLCCRSGCHRGCFCCRICVRLHFVGMGLAAGALAFVAAKKCVNK